MDFYKRIYRGIKPCPCCGGKASFGVVDCLNYSITCEKCGMSSKSVMLPDYSTKRKDRIIGRLYNRSKKTWNRRTVVYE